MKCPRCPVLPYYQPGKFQSVSAVDHEPHGSATGYPAVPLENAGFFCNLRNFHPCPDEGWLTSGLND